MTVQMNPVDRKAARGILKKLTTHIRDNTTAYKVYWEQDDGSFELLTAAASEGRIVDKEVLRGRELVTIYLEVPKE